MSASSNVPSLLEFEGKGKGGAGELLGDGVAVSLWKEWNMGR